MLTVCYLYLDLYVCICIYILHLSVATTVYSMLHCHSCSTQHTFFSSSTADPVQKSYFLRTTYFYNTVSTLADGRTNRSEQNIQHTSVPADYLKSEGITEERSMRR
jgi:hypothetical protein